MITPPHVPQCFHSYVAPDTCNKPMMVCRDQVSEAVIKLIRLRVPTRSICLALSHTPVKITIGETVRRLRSAFSSVILQPELEMTSNVGSRHRTSDATSSGSDILLMLRAAPALQALNTNLCFRS